MMTSMPELSSLTTIATASPARIRPEHSILETKPDGAATSLNTGVAEGVAGAGVAGAGVAGAGVAGVAAAMDGPADEDRGDVGAAAVGSALGLPVSRVEEADCPHPAKISQQPSRLPATLRREMRSAGRSLRTSGR